MRLASSAKGKRTKICKDAQSYIEKTPDRKTKSPTSTSDAELPVQETVETPAPPEPPEATSSPQTSPRGEAEGELSVSAPAAAPPPGEETLIGRSQAKTSADGSGEASGMAKVVSRVHRAAGKSRRAG